MRYADAITAKRVEAPVETKAEPSLKGFIAWLANQDPHHEYEFADCRGRCLVGQYMNSIGLVWNYTRGAGSYAGVCRKLFGCRPGSDIPRQWVASAFPRTFGAALARAQKLADHS